MYYLRFQILDIKLMNPTMKNSYSFAFNKLQRHVLFMKYILISSRISIFIMVKLKYKNKHKLKVTLYNAKMIV